MMWTIFGIKRSEIGPPSKEKTKMLKRFVLGWCLIFLFVSCRSRPLNLTALGSQPDWSRLEVYQETMTREEFLNLLDEVYLEKAGTQNFIQFFSNHAQIQKSNLRENDFFVLRFLPPSENSKMKDSFQFWKKTPENPTKDKPLQGFRIALDPGHIGGEYAKKERRWFQLEGSQPVIEGDMNLKVAQLLKARLEVLGAEVFLVRDRALPLTKVQPDSMIDLAKQFLNDQKNYRKKPNDSDLKNEDPKIEIRSMSEVLAYQVAEIRERAKIINEKIKPDLTICIHFDAHKWVDPNRPLLVPGNHLHLLINGHYTLEELRYEDMRYEMLFKILSRAYPEELALSEKVALSMANEMQLPPNQYPRDAPATRVGNTSYVWARNLLANRLYQSPVLYLEPYVMNNLEVFERIQMGDYPEERKVGSQLRKSIYREYVDSVVNGVLNYYQEKMNLH